MTWEPNQAGSPPDGRGPPAGSARNDVVRPLALSWLGELLYSSEEAAWPGLLVQAWQGSGLHQCHAFALDRTTIFLHTAGHVETWIREGRSMRHYDLGRGRLSIIDRSSRLDSVTWSGSFRVLTFQLDHSQSARLLQTPAALLDRPLVTRLAIQDRSLWYLLSAIAAEIRAGCLSGSQYRELLSLALVSYVHARYELSRPDTGTRTPMLPPASRRQIESFIRANLHGDLTLSKLAAAVHVSPYHFARLFKNTFGLSPHQFVTRERVARARRLLRAERLSVAETGRAVGYCNQAHFATAFRRLTGISPRNYRIRHRPARAPLQRKTGC